MKPYTTKLLEISYQKKSVLQSLKASLGRPKLDTWCIMESMGLGLSGATCNGSVTPDLSWILGALWSPWVQVCLWQLVMDL